MRIPEIEAPEVATANFRGGSGEILRQASVALDGRPVTLWEVADGPTLVPRATSDPNPGIISPALTSTPP